MISVVATIIFFFMLFEAFNSSYTPQSVIKIYSTQIYDYIIVPKNIIHSAFVSTEIARRIFAWLKTKARRVLNFAFIGYIEIFQEPASSLMIGIIDLHNDIMVILVFVSIFVL
jgi:hypothetical protein